MDRISSSIVISDRSQIRSPLHSRIVSCIRPPPGDSVALNINFTHSSAGLTSPGSCASSVRINRLPANLLLDIQGGPLPRHSHSVLNVSGSLLPGNQHQLISGALLAAIQHMCLGPPVEALWKPLRSTPISSEITIGSPTFCGPSLRGWELSLAVNFGTWRRISSPHPLAVGLILVSFELNAWGALLHLFPLLPPRPPGLRTLCRLIGSAKFAPGKLQISLYLRNLPSITHGFNIKGLPEVIIHSPASVLEPSLPLNPLSAHILLHKGSAARLLPRVVAMEDTPAGNNVSPTPSFKKGDVVLASCGLERCTGVVTAYRSGYGFLSKLTIASPITLIPPHPICPAVVGRISLAISFPEFSTAPVSSDAGVPP